MELKVTRVTISASEGENEDAMKFEFSDGTIDYVNNVGPIINRVYPDGTRGVIGVMTGRSDYNEGEYELAQENWDGEYTTMTTEEYNEWEVNQPKLG